MKKRILIVDDQQNVLNAMRRDLRGSSLDCDVLTTTRGSEVVTLLSDNDIDLLLTDILMPQMNGIQVLTEVKNKFPQLKIITMSGGGHMMDGSSYLEITKGLGASYSLEKPFTREELVSAISQVLNEE